MGNGKINVAFFLLKNDWNWNNECEFILTFLLLSKELVLENIYRIEKNDETMKIKQWFLFLSSLSLSFSLSIDWQELMILRSSTEYDILVGWTESCFKKG